MSPKNNHAEIEKIVEIQEILDENHELEEKNDDLVEENGELEAEVKHVKKEVLWLIASILLISLLLGSGIGYYYYQNAQTRKALTATTTRALTAEETAKNEAKLRTEQELKLTQATQENQGLKDTAAKKAEEDAIKEQKAKEEADKLSRKYVSTIKKDSTLPGLNTRVAPCGDVAGTLRVWGTAGEVIEGPTKAGVCFGEDYEWYKVKWNDGVIGWSIANYLEFTGERQFSKTGVLTGYVPVGYDYETSQNSIKPTVCATNLGDKITYCNAEINSNQQSYKLVVPEGEYVMTGKLRYKDYDTKKIVEQDLIFSVSQLCGYTQDCYQKYPNGYRQNAKVIVSTNGIVTGVNLTSFYNDNGTPGVNTGTL
jgi:hypothetical protein